VDVLDPTVLVMKLPARRPALLLEGSQAIKPPPMRVGMIKAIIAMPLELNLPPHHVPNQTEMKATPAPGMLRRRVS
jgi:hypothetical protein